MASYQIEGAWNEDSKGCADLGHLRRWTSDVTAVVTVTRGRVLPPVVAGCYRRSGAVTCGRGCYLWSGAATCGRALLPANVCCYPRSWAGSWWRSGSDSPADLVGDNLRAVNLEE